MSSGIASGKLDRDYWPSTGAARGDGRLVVSRKRRRCMHNAPTTKKITPVTHENQPCRDFALRVRYGAETAPRAIRRIRGTHSNLFGPCGRCDKDGGDAASQA